MLANTSGGSFVRSTGTSSCSRISRRLASTARKLIVLIAKQTPTPQAAMMMPASAGPITREPLKRLAFSATAFGSSSGRPSGR